MHFLRIGIVIISFKMHVFSLLIFRLQHGSEVLSHEWEVFCEPRLAPSPWCVLCRIRVVSSMVLCTRVQNVSLKNGCYRAQDFEVFVICSFHENELWRL
jgi:hypothetical protein